MKQLSGLDVTLQDQLLLNKEQQNMDYLMELESDALLQNFTQEAGRYQNFETKNLSMAGWEDPLLSAAWSLSWSLAERGCHSL